MKEQLSTLHEIAALAGVPVSYVKPHGALYHASNQNPALVEAMIRGCLACLSTFTLVGPAGGAMEAAAKDHGLAFAREGFADRGVRPDGSLVPRGSEGALIEDPEKASRRARELRDSGTVDTICVHGDTPGALRIARAVRRELDEAAR